MCIQLQGMYSFRYVYRGELLGIIEKSTAEGCFDRSLDKIQTISMGDRGMTGDFARRANCFEQKEYKWIDQKNISAVLLVRARRIQPKISFTSQENVQISEE